MGKGFRFTTGTRKTAISRGTSAALFGVVEGRREKLMRGALALIMVGVTPHKVYAEETQEKFNTTESGLQFLDLVLGEGDIPKPTQTVKQT
jgi:hypothetical protein